MEFFFICSLLALSLIYLLHIAAEKWSRSHHGKLPPGPTPLPIVGNLFELGDMPHRSLARLAKTYGPVMALKLGQTTTIVISSPDAARQVLQLHDQFLSARAVPDVVRAHGHNEVSMVWLPTCQQWKHLRTIVRTHLFTSQRLDANQGLRRQKVQELVEHVRGRIGQTVDIGRAALCTALNQISNTFFSVDLASLDSDSAQEFKDFMTEMMEEVGRPNVSEFFPLLRLIDPQGRRRRMAACLSKLYKMFDEMINERLRERAQGEKTSRDFLDALLELHLQDNSNFDIRTIKCLLADVFVGGSDTSTTVVEWAMAELLRNPSLLAKLRTELKTVIGPGKQVEESDISSLAYLQAVVKETLRMHPPGPFLLPHKAEKSVEVGGYIVPKNSRVLVNAWAIGHDSTVWEDPELFLPERFLTSDVDFRGQNFEYVPFGSGRRICPGLPLAYRMVHLMLGSLVHSFEWTLPAGMKTADIDFTEKFGLTVTLAIPLPAIPLPLNY